jgi:hypothetical protein
MPALNEPLNLGDLIKYEEDSLNYSRDHTMNNPFNTPGFLDGGFHLGHQHHSQPLRSHGGPEPLSGQAGAHPPVIVEEQNGVLNLLPTLPPGQPRARSAPAASASLRSFVMPHIPHDDVVLPEEVQGIRAFGSETEMESVASVMARTWRPCATSIRSRWSTCAWVP